MKKLTAGILASLIGLVSANSAEAAVASTQYVNDGLATKQDTLTTTNFIAPAETGDFINGFTVNNGTVTFTSGKLPAAAVVDAALSETSTNAIQNQAVAKKIAEMALTTDGQSGVIKTVKQTAGKVEVTSGTVAEADIADNAVTSAKIADSAVTSAKILDGTIATGDIANAAVTSEKIADNAVTSAKIVDGTIENADIKDVDMAKVTGLAAELDKKQDNITWGTNITVGGDGKVSATDTTYTAGAGIQLNGTEFSADVTTTVLNTELAKKQNKLVAGNQGDNVQLTFDEQGNLLKISATDTTYTTGTADASGLTKLYTTTGDAEDGTMTQKAITDELATKQAKLTQADNAGTGITIDATGKISADNQLNKVTETGDEGLQVLTRDCSTGTCVYVWEEIDRTFNAQ